MLSEFEIRNYGSIVLFIPLTDNAQRWWDENVNPEAMVCGPGYAVEHRFAHNIASAIKEEQQ